MHIQGTVCQARQCAPKDNTKAGSVKQLCVNLPWIQNGESWSIILCRSCRITPRAQRACTLCQTGFVMDEQCLVFDCPALQGFKDRYSSLFGDHAALIFTIWRHDIRAVVQSSKNVWMRTVILAVKAGHQISARWLDMN